MGEGQGGHFAGTERVDGRAVDQQHALANIRQQAILALVNLFHLSRRRQHGDDRLDVGLGHRRGRVGTRGAGLDKGGDSLGAGVEDGDAMAGLEQVAGHWAAHVAETKKTDMHGGYLCN
ncbi:hypothetical protein D3C86_1910290 [compost metagenome]